MCMDIIWWLQVDGMLGLPFTKLSIFLSPLYLTSNLDACKQARAAISSSPLDNNLAENFAVAWKRLLPDRRPSE